MTVNKNKLISRSQINLLSDQIEIDQKIRKFFDANRKLMDVTRKKFPFFCDTVETKYNVIGMCNVCSINLSLTYNLANFNCNNSKSIFSR